MDEPMNSEQIKDFLKGDVACLTYSDLKNIESIDDALEAVKYIFVLYEYKPNYGHWTCILKTKGPNGKPAVEFFDPYGIKPDHQIKGFSQKIKNEYGMNYPLVVKLLKESKYPIEYNNYKLQKYDPNIQTCGRWCMMRCLFDDLDVNKFKDLFTNKKISKDELVTIGNMMMS